MLHWPESQAGIVEGFDLTTTAGQLWSAKEKIDGVFTCTWC